MIFVIKGLSITLALCVFFNSAWLDAMEQAPADIFDLGQPVFEAIAAQDENKAANVTAIVEDLTGFIWIGDEKGLRRFDGYRYKIYAAETDDNNRINTDSIYTLAVDNNNNIWVGTATSGLAILQASTGQFLQVELPSTEGFSTIRSIVNNPKGGMWVATNKVIYRLDDNFQVTASYSLANVADDDGSHYIKDLLVDEQQQLWVGSSKALFKVDQDGVMNLVPITDKPPYISVLFEDSEGAIWVGTLGSGLFKLNTDGHVLARLEDYATDSLLETTPGQLWLGTAASGLVKIDTNTYQVIKQFTHDVAIPHSLGMNQIRAIMVDRAGLIWIGTWGKGLYRFNPNNLAFANLYHSPSNPHSLSKNQIANIQEMSDGKMLFAVYGHGVDLFSPKQGRLKTFDGSHGADHLLNKSKMIYMTQGSAEEVWLSIVNVGLVRYTPDTDQFEYISEFSGATTLDVLWGSDGALLVMTTKGLKRFYPHSREIQDFYQGENSQTVDTHRYRNIIKMADGTLWMNSDSALFMVKPNSQLIQPVWIINDLHQASDRINGLSIDSKNNFYFSSKYQLFKFSHWQDTGSHQGVFDNILLTSEEMEKPAIAGELFDDMSGQLWGGKFAVDSQTGDMDYFGLADGMGIENIWENTKKRSKSGTLLFASPSGVLMVRPPLYKKWDYMPPVVITDTYIDSENVHIQGDHLTLSPDNHRVTIEFSSLDYTAPTKNKYAYKLTGNTYDDWHYVDHAHRSVSFTNLAPGDYSLQIKGSNRKGKWSDDMAQLAISILPAWYQTWWFRSFMLFTFGLLLMVLFKWRVRQMTAKRRELEVLVKQRPLSLEQQTVRLEDKSQSLQLKTLEATSALDQLLLTQNELVESEKHASLGRLVVGVSHELNTPLGVAKLAIDQLSIDSQDLTQMMLSGALSKTKFLRRNESISQASDLVKKNVDRAADLVARFKTLSTQQATANVKKIEMDAYTQDILTSLEYQYSQMKGRIHISTGDTPQIELDVAALDKVLACLMENAVQHAFTAGTDDAKIAITLGLQSHHNKDRLMLSFKDNGRGIDADVLPLIFDPFYTTLRDSGAVGLGLHAAFNLVTQSLRGTIECHSKLYEGTTFILYIPITPESG
jgi:ligand-binding sensor domain-containing protein/signal transduction histidine kinase